MSTPSSSLPAALPRPDRLRRPARPALPSRPARPTRESLRAKARAPRQPALAMSDYWFMLGLWLALFFVADPFRWRLDLISITKHLPLALALAGVILVNIGHWIFPPRNDPARNRYWQALGVSLPLTLLGLWIVIAGIYARKFEGIHNSFLTVGLYMLFAVLTARVVMLSPARGKIVRYFLISTAIAAIFMLVVMVVSTAGAQDPISYHEMEALVVPLAVYFALRPMNNQHWQALLTLGFLVGGLVFRKNTGFLVLGLTLIYLWIAEWRFRFRESGIFRFWTALWLVIIIGAGTAAAGYLAYQRSQVMPTGNPEYRLRTYERAWDRFLESPVWGTGFVAPATEKFQGYQILAADGILATHSDILDMAAQGGALALLLWLWGYIRIIRFSLKNALRGRPRSDLQAAAHAFACMSLTSIVVYAFNPILLQPAKALLLWAQLGMLIGIGLHFSNIEKSAAEARSKKLGADKPAGNRAARDRTAIAARTGRQAMQRPTDMNDNSETKS